MGKEKNKEDILVTEAYLPEGMLCGLFWKYPDLYAEYSEEKLNKNTFGNYVYAFYFSLGRRIYKQGFSIFDDTCTYKVVSEFKAIGEYEKLGGFETIRELMEEAEDKRDNIEGYYETVKKYEMLRQLREILGDKVIETNGKYNYKELNGPQIHKYWMSILNDVIMDSNSGVEEKFLLEGLDEAINEWNSHPDIGLEFYDSPKWTGLCSGFAPGHVYINGAFSGKGKTSIAMSKLIMSCIVNNEKLLVCANEQSLQEFQKLMFVTAFGILGIKFERQRLNKGGFTESELKSLHRAKKWIESVVSNPGDKNATKLIAFAFIENYSIDNLIATLRHYAVRGYKRVLIDTTKPTEGDTNGMARWERFSSDFDQIYKIARINGGGLGLAIFCSVQLADHAINKRFLEESVLGDSKKIKNVASCLFLWRSVFEDELEGGDYELQVVTHVKIADKDEFNEEDGEIISKPVYKEIKTALPKNGGPYYLMFTAKNRRGMDCNTGADVLVFSVDFNSNKWTELGWTKVYRDRNYPM